MAEPEESDLQNTGHQSEIPVGNIKASSFPLWITICGIAGFLILCFLILMFILSMNHGFDPSIIRHESGLGICNVLGLISLALIMVAIFRARRLAGFILIGIPITAFLIYNRVGPTKLGPTKSHIAKIQISEFEQVLEVFHYDTLRYPTTDEGLDALVHNPGNIAGWKGPYLKRETIPPDLWGKPYHYRYLGCNRDFYDLWSDGKDGVEGTDDDVIKPNCRK
jgi:general secretion pathway protein G